MRSPEGFPVKSVAESAPKPENQAEKVQERHQSWLRKNGLALVSGVVLFGAFSAAGLKKIEAPPHEILKGSAILAAAITGWRLLFERLTRGTVFDEEFMERKNKTPESQ